MIFDGIACEPYILLRGHAAGTIHWFDESRRIENPELWMRYCDFERDKIQEMAGEHGATLSGLNVCSPWGFGAVIVGHIVRDSETLIGYNYADYRNDSESGRLLKRAEFFKKYCETEGVEWVPVSDSPKQL